MDVYSVHTTARSRTTTSFYVLVVVQGTALRISSFNLMYDYIDLGLLTISMTNPEDNRSSHNLSRFWVHFETSLFKFVYI
jgi:hypothetical protein